MGGNLLIIFFEKFVNIKSKLSVLNLKNTRFRDKKKSFKNIIHAMSFQKKKKNTFTCTFYQFHFFFWYVKIEAQILKRCLKFILHAPFLSSR